MKIFFICFFATLLHLSFTLIEENADLDALSSYDELEQPFEGNFENVNTLDTLASRNILDICKNSRNRVYVQQDDIIIDCILVNQPRNNEDIIVKRSAADQADEVEGSGNGIDEIDSVVAVTEKGESNDTTPVEKEDSEVNGDYDNVEDDTNDMQKEVELTTVVHEHEEPPTEHEHEEPATESPRSGPSEHLSPLADENTEDNTNGEHTTDSDPQQGQESEPATIKPEDEAQKENEGPAPATEAPNNLNTEESLSISENASESINNKEPETDPEKHESKDKKKGRTLINKENSEAENVKPSTEDPKKAGSRDTTILVVLFVAVVVVGALAFGYNFIRKRRQRRADIEQAVPASPIKRSFQNLSKNDDEPEQKPLMGDNKEVEMINMKKESPAANNTVVNT